MQSAAQAYGRTAQQTLTGRDLEAHVLLKAAARLQTIRDNWTERRGELEDALTNNRKLWTVLVTGATDSANPLNNATKSAIASLAVFIFNHTISLMIDPQPQRLQVLININKEIAAGLRASNAAVLPTQQSAA